MQGTPQGCRAESRGPWGHRGLSRGVTGATRDMASSSGVAGAPRDTGYHLWGNGDAWGQQAPSYGVRGPGHLDTQGTKLWGDGDTL